MRIDAKLVSPICVRLGKNPGIITSHNGEEKTYPLVPGAIFAEGHYGFVLISEHNGRQREAIYSTQCRIQAIGMNHGTLMIFEEGKEFPWQFTKKGKLEHSTFDEFTKEFKSPVDIISENYDMFVGEPQLIHPIQIKISRNPGESVILHDENISKDYPLWPGAILVDVHYGFVLIIDSEEGVKEAIYPTQNRIDAVGIEKSPTEVLKVFEKGKYRPWIFGCDGVFKEKASYNPFSKLDKEFIQDCYGVNKNTSEFCFTLQKKKG